MIRKRNVTQKLKKERQNSKTKASDVAVNNMKLVIEACFEFMLEKLKQEGIKVKLQNVQNCFSQKEFSV